MVIIQLQKPITIGWAADLNKGEVPLVKMEAKKSLQIRIDEEKGTVSLIEGKA